MTIQNANHIQNQVAIAIATQRESSPVEINGEQEQHDQPESGRRRSFTLSATPEYGDSGGARSDGIMTEVHKCFMVSGIDREYEYLNGIYHPEREDLFSDCSSEMDGVPCYRKHWRDGNEGGVSAHTITRRDGIWYIGFNHQEIGWYFAAQTPNARGSEGALLHPPNTGWWTDFNSEGVSRPNPLIRIEEINAPYYGWTLEDELHGEYENVELPENNTEKAREIKGSVRDIGEKVFDVKDQLKEGDYLEIMNLLQVVTNRVNSL